MKTTPLPQDDEVNLEVPDLDEVTHISRGIASAAAGDDGLSELQVAVLGSLTEAMTGYTVDFGHLEPMTAEDFAAGLASRNEAFRTRMVQIMELGHMILPEPSLVVADRVIEFAAALEIDNDCIHAARDVAEGSRQLVAADFDRSIYLNELDLSAFTPLRSAEDNNVAWTSARDDGELADRWRRLGDLPEQTLGRGVHDFYVARGFRWPGEPGSAPPLLAQHDWVHVIADYGSTVESELEVFAFIARASDNPQAFALLAMVVNLFETGNLANAAGIFEADPGHLSDGGMPQRFADALRRGALCKGSVDFLATDFFAIAEHDINDVRSHFGVVAKSAAAIEGGSVGPHDAGSISPFQLAAGQALAKTQGREYDSFGASL